MCMIITVCGSLMHGECCRLCARKKLDQHDNTDVISVIAFMLFPQNGDTALHEASRYGRFEVVKLLVQFHADVNDKNKVNTESPH